MDHFDIEQVFVQSEFDEIFHATSPRLWSRFRECGTPKLVHDLQTAALNSVNRPLGFPSDGWCTG